MHLFTLLCDLYSACSCSGVSMLAAIAIGPETWWDVTSPGSNSTAVWCLIRELLSWWSAGKSRVASCWTPDFCLTSAYFSLLDVLVLCFFFKCPWCRKTQNTRNLSLIWVCRKLGRVKTSALTLCLTLFLSVGRSSEVETHTHSKQRLFFQPPGLRART